MMKRLFQNLGWLLGGRATNAILSLVYLALATRTLGLESFGQFAIIVAMGQIVTGVANFQTWQFVVRWGAGDDGPRQATGFAIALDLLSVVAGTAMAAVLVWTAQFWLPLPDDLLWATFGYCVISLLAIRSTPIGLLRLRFAFARATAAEAVQPIVRAAGAALAAVLMPTVLGLLIVWAVAEIAVAASVWFAALRKDRVDPGSIDLRTIPQNHPDAWTFVLSTNMSGTLIVAGKQLMILLVGAIGGEALAGVFRVAAQLGQALVMLAQTISKAVYPELVHAKEDAQDIARRMAIIALAGGALAVLASVVFGRWGIAIVAGEEFRGAYWPMVILAIGGAIELVGASLESLLVSAKRAGTAFIARAVPTLLGFVFLEEAMGWNGLKGAAICLMGASALTVIGFWVAIISLKQIRIVVDEAEP